MQLIFINGFLGSGKTTMMNHLLHQHDKVGVIVNDFGDINVDSQLMKMNGPMIQIENGSIFCSCNSHQFVESLIEMNKQDIDYLIIESSGFSNPGSLNNVIKELKKLNQIDYKALHKVTIVDSILFNKTRNLLPVQRQIEVADILAINKVDLANNQQVNDLKNELSKMNPKAKIMFTKYGQLDLEVITKDTHQSHFSSDETSRDISFSTLTIPLSNKSVSKTLVYETLKELSDDVYRVKGFMMIDNQLMLVELASQQISIKEVVQNNQDLALVILYSIKNIGKQDILKRLKLLPIQ